MAEKYYFNTKDLVIIAILGCLGALLSTYVGYIGQTFGQMTGIPNGGQLLTGLHVFWVILVLALVNKKGAGLIAALLDNFVQFLMGGHLGFWVLPIGVLEGLFAEIGYWPLKKHSRALALAVAGGLSAWSNLIVVQLAYNAFGTVYLFGTVSVFSAVSGVIFGGCLSYAIFRVLQNAGIIVKKDDRKAGAGQVTPSK